MRQLVPAFAFFLVLWAFFGTNNVLELRAEEPRRAIVALEMVLQDQWTVPTIHGEPYYNKPPVFNWVLASFYRLTGSTNEWVTRLPGLLSLLLLAGAHYLFTRKYLGETIARWSAVFLLCTGDLLFYGAVNSGEIDLFYALVSYLQVACIFHFFHRRQWWLLYLGSYALMTVGLLTKGLSSLPLQGFTLLALLLYHRQWKALFAPAHFVGLGLSFGLLLLYFQQYANLNDPWPYLTNLVNEASHKTGAETPLLETVQHLVSFPLQVLQVLLPWSLLLVLFFRKGTGKTLWQNDWLRYSVLFLAANLWLYWLSPGTKNRYLYLFFPFLLSLFTWMWLTFRERAPQLVKWANHGLTVALGIGVLVLLALPWAGGDELIRQHTALLWCLPVFGVLALVLHLQWKDWRPASLVIFLFLFRIGFNAVYLPTVMAKEQQLTYRAEMDQVLLITKEAPVFYTGYPYTRNTEARLGPLSFGQYELKLPPLLPYQVPYYLSRANGHVMAYHPRPEPNNWYIASKKFAERYTAEVFYEFRDRWTSKQMVLFRVKNEDEVAVR